MVVYGDAGSAATHRVTASNVKTNGTFGRYLGRVDLEGMDCNSANDVYFLRNVAGGRIANSTVTLGRLAGDSTKLTIDGCTVTAATFLFNTGFDDHVVINSTLNSVFYRGPDRYPIDQIASNVGDAAATLTVASSPRTQRWQTALTAARAVTLSTTGAKNGDRFRIIRTAAATGDYKLNVGTGPLVALVAGEWCDVEYTGSAWMVTAHFPVGGSRLVGADVGDAAKTLTVGASEATQVWNTAITADRAVTLNTGAARSGDRFRIVRTANATGAFNINVGTGPLKALGTAGSFCDVEYNGSAWMLTAYGLL
jgi:hypothetical protein